MKILTLTLLNSSFSLGVIFLSDWNMWTAVFVAEITIENLCKYQKVELLYAREYKNTLSKTTRNSQRNQMESGWRKIPHKKL